MNHEVTHVGAEGAGHYVYVYRDMRGRTRYVGYGRKVTRAVSRDRSAAMAAFLSDGRYTLQIAGPYGSKEAGLAVETALISLLRPDLNSERAPGPTRFRFRPLGLPHAFADRLDAPPITEGDLAGIGEETAYPLLFVLISNRDFEGEDPRKGYSLDRPLSDPEILARMDRWWQLGRHVERWIAEPDSSPGTLVGLTGPPAHRMIIGAVPIDRRGWSAAMPEHGQLYRVPTLPSSKLDAHGLRGRRLSPIMDVRFGRVMSQFFVILGRDGKRIDRV
jgi:hypothetical protein